MKRHKRLEREVIELKGGAGRVAAFPFDNAQEQDVPIAVWMFINLRIKKLLKFSNQFHALHVRNDSSVDHPMSK